MFGDSTNLKTIIVSDSFVTTGLDDPEMEEPMFKDCTSLVGGAGTTYSEDYTGKEYARIDRGPASATPGYFTAKSEA